MAKAPAIAPAPKNLSTHGTALWKSILSDIAEGWQLDARELHLLERACRCEDDMRELESAIDREGYTTEGSKGQVVVHPAVSEVRQMRLTQLRLLSDLELVDPIANRSSRPASSRARRAANARWGTGGNS